MWLAIGRLAGRLQIPLRLPTANPVGVRQSPMASLK